MNHINEVIELAQMLQSAMDDTEGGIIGLDISGSNGAVHFNCMEKYFLENFSTYDVVKKNSIDYPVELQHEVEGIVFHALVPTAKIHQIKSPLALACE